MRRDAQFSVVCLGTGKGASTVYDGTCSPGYVLCVNGRPLILFGAGYGVTRQCLRYFGVVPSNIFVFSNRSHMSAELPVIIAVESRSGRRLRIIASEAVMVRLREHRLAEVRSRLEDVRAADDGGGGVCDFVAMPCCGAMAGANLLPYCLPEVETVSLVVFDASATEASCGVAVSQNGVPLVALTGDCAYNPELHHSILRMAPVVILDGRHKASRDHAGFANILHAVANCGVPPQRVFIGQYGQPWEAPLVVKGGVVFPIVEGAVVALGEEPPRAHVLAASTVTEGVQRAERWDVDDEKEGELVRPAALVPSRRVDAQTHSEVRPKKVFLVNNESPDASPALMMVQQLRTMAQVKQRVSELLHLRPVGALFSAETGHRLTSLSHLLHGMRVVATKVGGRPFGDPPASRLSEMKQSLTVPWKPLERNSSLSLELRDYMQRAYQSLRGRVGCEALAAVNTTTRGDDEGAAVVPGSRESCPRIHSASGVTAELSPETPYSGEHVSAVQRDTSGRGGAVCSLRFTTLGA
ncbi:putative periplasmic protein [Trypanosoma rangeli]|uniref:Putative periplasmic protein n=1 Tax=Trypanosoma rangeli TaxID=5698 RepID=A0A3R7LT95_TRYRA|nr:putative periplasmic protein [Trypanosoma rangeli]RNF02901.1 putative periplasmic protein [Trypanosoma rangeli]|eukprot:RNF02901.1 putative periplasmic protein [Trypanosoma rangeli]